MTQRPNDELILRFIDGDLTDEERRLLEIRLEGDPESLKRLHLLLRTKDIIRELPQYKCPVNLAERFREFRKAEEKRSKLTIERTALGTLLRIGAIAAVLAVVFTLAFSQPALRPERERATRVAENPVTVAIQPAMKVASDELFTKFDPAFKTHLDTEMNNIKISAGKKPDLTPMISFHMSDLGQGPAMLRDIFRNLSIELSPALGYTQPVYTIKDISKTDLEYLLEKLRKADPSLALDENVRNLESASGTGLFPVTLYFSIIFSND